MAKTILVVDDKSSVRKLLREYLTEQNYKVVPAANGLEAIYAARHSKPDLILLDIMMPEMDGFEFLRQYRQEGDAPVIVITAREEETDTVLGLELGADDYVIKPFRMKELEARIRAVLRRVEPAQERGKTLHYRNLSLDQSSHHITVDGGSVDLTPIEFDLLSILMSAPGQVFTRAQLSDQLYESGFAGLERTLNVHIRNLRSKIEPDPNSPEYIETVFGVGYRLRWED